ncbi:hypothetical protein Zmor_006506 [Zophobas morio]|uniref:Uncharacterized protein n=1 Tax=Zophobas morio TaxID=2755281 RepID=A0AA38IV16_9CUCU|nr:hypothetical protein Zmor_006506 [Zophobas morio]
MWSGTVPTTGRQREDVLKGLVLGKVYDSIDSAELALPQWETRGDCVLLELGIHIKETLYISMCPFPFFSHIFVQQAIHLCGTPSWVDFVELI